MLALDDLVKQASKNAKVTIAVAAAHDRDVMEAVISAGKEGIADAILIGDVNRICEIMDDMGENSNKYEIIPASDNTACARKAVQLVRTGKVNLLMKGILDTAELMRAVIDKETGIRTGNLISHTMVYESPSYHKLLFLTDGGMNTFPDLNAKKEILKNTARLMRALGYEEIQAACVCGAEKVNPKITSTVDAQSLSDMTSEWAPYHMNVYGPVGLDLAISPQACRHKGYSVKGGGKADILLVPNYEVGNGIGKALSCFGNAKNAGIVLGASAPIILVSRSDSAQSKLYSIALGSVVTAAFHEHN
ncbi:MAG: phosphate butyryltransferase [Lachnospiraceae bacterium]|nr:phosphate butyryltransferase [Lachnospiraceae bacterium]